MMVVIIICIPSKRIVRQYRPTIFNTLLFGHTPDSNGMMIVVQYRVKSLGFERDRRVSPPNLSIYHYFQLTMPRQPLRGISGNSTYRGGIAGRFELTPHWRSHILGCYSGGQC